MRDYADWRIPWLPMGLLVLLVALTAALAFFQLFLKFDLETSPAWQVGVHYLMLSLFLSTIFVVAFQRSLVFGERLRMVMLVLAVLVPVAVFAGGWVLGGAYSGLRDPRLSQVMVVSLPSFVLSWMVVFLPYSCFLLVRAFFKHFRCPSAVAPR